MKGFAVHPKLDCPHLTTKLVDQLGEFLLNKNTKHFSQFQCAKCNDKSQNWICLQCKTIACSRYVKGHMAEHYDQYKHPITLSFSDSSFWCYECDSYIDHPSLIKARKQFSKSKFASKKQNEEKATAEKTQEKQLQQELKKLDIKQQPKPKKEQEQQEKLFAYEQIIHKLKNKHYKKVVFLTGAGLSVAAGIPDFRTPGTGLYSQLQKFNLPRPQSVFELSYYAKNPLPFIKLAKQWSQGNFQPTDGHKFIKKMQQQNLLHCCMTQNIDDLQFKAGISPQKLIQAHGHSRSARCIKCKKQASIEDWIQKIKNQQPLSCKDQTCLSLIKPDITFFGEQLPQKFFEAPDLVKEADLVIVIGTSLLVFPFAMLASMVKDDVPLILVNNTDSLQRRKNKVWMAGDLQENIRKLAKDLEWTL